VPRGFIPSLARATFLAALGVFAGVALLVGYKAGAGLSERLFGVVGARTFTVAFVLALSFGAAALARRPRPR